MGWREGVDVYDCDMTWVTDWYLVEEWIGERNNKDLLLVMFERISD